MSPSQLPQISRQEIEKYWPLTNVRIGEVLNQNDARLVGVLESNKGKFVYKVANRYKNSVAIEKETLIFDFLHDKGFEHAPSHLKTRLSENFETIENRQVYLLKYIEGSNPPEIPETFSTLGEITAKLHNIEGYPHNTDFVISKIIPSLYERADLFSFGEEYKELLSQLPVLEGLSQTLIHTDINHSNAVQRPDGKIILVDWDDVGNGPAVIDLGSPLISTFISEEGEFRRNNAEAFYSAYFSKRDLPEEDKNKIFDAGLFFALDYIIYGDMQKRWQRIQWAINHRQEIEKIYL